MTGSSKAIELGAGALTLTLRPDVGGSIAGFWHRDHPVLRSADAASLARARSSGCYPLVPYSNRIGHCRFPWGGQERTTQPNFEGSPHSLHGVGFTRPWHVVKHDQREAELLLSHAADAEWPFAFEATQFVSLDEQGLSLRLSVTNRADEPAPMGLGWHPYFPKRSRSRLHAEVSGRWDTDDTRLPVRHVPQHSIDADIAHLDYDHCFTGWQGTAKLRDEHFSLRLTSSLTHLVVYTPPLQDFYAVEPVSHANNALNMPEPEAHGVMTLAPGATASAWMKLEILEVRA